MLIVPPKILSTKKSCTRLINIFRVEIYATEEDTFHSEKESFIDNFHLPHTKAYTNGKSSGVRIIIDAMQKPPILYDFSIYKTT